MSSALCGILFGTQLFYGCHHRNSSSFESVKCSIDPICPPLKWQDRFGGERGCSSDGHGVTLPGRRIKRLEIGKLFRVGDRSMSQEQGD